jgi:hypothetical protein
VRRLELSAEALGIADTLAGVAGRELVWTFPLAGGHARVVEHGVEATVGDVVVRFAGEVDWTVERGWYSPRYGVRVEVPYVRARRVPTDARSTTEIALRFSRSGRTPGGRLAG